MAGYILWLIIVFNGMNVACLGKNACCDESGCKMNRSQSTCNDGSYLFNKHCMRTCPDGYYGDQGKCLSCVKTCATCEHSHCTSCHTLYLTKNKLCRADCPDGTVKKSSVSRWVRLVHGATPYEGIVEVYYNGHWGSICGDSWNGKAAQVVCNELHFGKVVETRIVNQQRFSNSKNQEKSIWLSGVECNGNEKTLFDCKHKSWGSNECSHLEDVGIRCFGPDSSRACVTSCGDGYRLFNGTCLECPIDCKTCNSSGACLECADQRYLDGIECVSKCRDASYSNSRTGRCDACPTGCLICSHDPGHSKIVCQGCMEGLYLNGDKCSKSCSHKALLAPYLRLSNKYTTLRYEGLVEIRYKSQWKTVCDYGFDIEDAKVICRELGFGEPRAWQPGWYGSGTGEILVTNAQCVGNETRFIDCEQSNWPAKYCSHDDDIGLACYPPKTGVGMTGSCVDKCPRGTYLTSENKCELCNRACLSCADSPERCTECREPYYLNDTQCSLTCHNGLYITKPRRVCQRCVPMCTMCVDKPDNCLACIPTMLLSGAKCVKKCPKDMYRKGFKCVKDCSLYHYGDPQLGVCHSCPVNCLVCKQHKSNNVSCHLCVAGFVPGIDGQCVTTCPHGDVIAPANITKYGLKPRLRLLNTVNNMYAGRLEIFHNNIWGSVCDDRWTMENSKVACRELFLGVPVGHPYSDPTSYKQLNISRIWLDQVVCDGDEDSIGSCKHQGWGKHNCDHTEDVHIVCSTPGVSTCQKQCPVGFYKNNNTCQPCHEGCIDCNGHADNCTTCVNKYHKYGDDTCLLKCPFGYYATKERHCAKCSKTCLTCENLNDDCTSCLPHLVQYDKYCRQHCPPGVYPREKTVSLVKKTGPYEGLVQVTVDGKTGYVCDWSLTTRDSKVICRELNMGSPVKKFRVRLINKDSYIQPKPVLKNPVCSGDELSYTQCTPGIQFCFHSFVGVQCSGPDSSSTCLECDVTDGYFIRDNKTCVPCAKTCLTCSNVATNCTTCKQGHVLNGAACVNFCPDGTYLRKSGKRCLPCHPNCAACYVYDYCTRCAAGEYLTPDQSCKKTCKTGWLTKVGVSGIRLTTRNVVEILHNRTWSAICYDDWNKEGHKNDMVACRQLGYGYGYDEPVSLMKTVEDPYQDILEPFLCNGDEKSLWQCKQAHTCRHSTMLATARCNKYAPKEHCVLDCGIGYYKVPGQDECKTCSSSCLTCSDSPDRCTLCNDTAFLYQNSKCLRRCPKGFYGNMRSRSCEQCAVKCGTCLDGWTNDRCTSCKDRYYLKNLACVDDCYPWQSLETLKPLIKPSLVVRLRNGSGMNDGVLEYYHNKQWELVCSFTKSHVVDIVCRSLGYKSGTTDYNTDIDVGISLSSTTLEIECNKHSQYIEDCDITATSHCFLLEHITCSQELIDYRVCRKVIPKTCRDNSCYKLNACVDGDGGLVPYGHSFCVSCPRDFYGDGDNCTEIAKRPWSVDKPFVSQTAEYGRQLRIKCNAYAGHNMMPKYATRYSWVKDGKQLQVENSDFVKNTAHYSDAGIYVCTLRSSLGAWSITYNISVMGQPIVISAPNIDVLQHTNAMLHCHALGLPEPSITWYRAGKPIVTSPGYKVLANGSLEIINVTKQQEGKYTCNSRNTFGNEKVDVLLRVLEEEGFKVKANEQIVQTGETAKFSCKALHDDVKISWRRNGVTLRSSDRIEVNNEGDLVIRNVTQQDCGEYYCVIKKEKYIATSVGTLVLSDEPPCIYHKPQNLDLKAGMDARFYCRACGQPPPVIHWKHRKIQSFPNAFEVKNTSLTDVGVYVCYAQSGRRSSEAYAFLSVDQQYACPYISSKPTSIPDAIQGTQQSFLCDGSAVPTFNITWYFNNDVIIVSDNKYSLSRDNRKLIINDVQEDDTGQYTCVVRSPYGQQTAEASLKVVSGPTHEPREKTSSKVGVVIGILVLVFAVLLIMYFVWRYRKDGLLPIDVITDIKRKTVACLARESRPTRLRSELDYVYDNNEIDSPDTNPFVRD